MAPGGGYKDSNYYDKPGNIKVVNVLNIVLSFTLVVIFTAIGVQSEGYDYKKEKLRSGSFLINKHKRKK